MKILLAVVEFLRMYLHVDGWSKDVHRPKERTHANEIGNLENSIKKFDFSVLGFSVVNSRGTYQCPPSNEKQTTDSRCAHLCAYEVLHSNITNFVN
jgi:hypothetical protein